MDQALPIRLIATDVDGTLLNSRGEITKENLDAIHRAQQAGITVAICSGRFAENVYLLLQDYQLSCPIIAVNGAKIVDENRRILANCFMAQQAAMDIHQALRSLGSDYFIFGRDSLCSASDRRMHHSELSQGQRVRALGYGYTHGRDAAEGCIQQPVQKFYVCDNVPLDQVRKALTGIEGITLTQSAPTNIEIMPEGIDKGYGVAQFARILDISLTQVMTLGDQENDIPMLMRAGYGVAMGNASPKTKASARYITTTHDESGFAHAINRWAFPQG